MGLPKSRLTEEIAPHRRVACWPKSSASSANLLSRARAIAELEARADVDPLLDILNRRGFERELKRSLAYVERYGTDAALIFIDLDGFKAVNDRHGHAAGDALLKAVARELIGHVRASDVVAGSAVTNSAC